jgi:hypothetical protein
MALEGLPLPTFCASSDPASVGQRLASYQEPNEKRLPADPVSVEAMSRHEVHRRGVGGEMWVRTRAYAPGYYMPPLRG